jgi:electron transfer flavoprotein alpha subunit
MAILVIAEHDNQSIKAATLNTLTAAAQLGAEVDVLVAGHQCVGAAQQVAALAGVRQVMVVDAAHYADQLPENLAALVHGLAGGYSHILANATTFGKNFLPRVAALLDVAQISDVVGIQSAEVFVRPIYAGNALATVRSTDPVKVLTVRGTAFAPAEATATVAPVVTVAAAQDLGLSQRESCDLAAATGRPELPAAKVVVSGGRGLGSGEQYHALLEPLADSLGAALGASRAAVDAGFVANDYQVGQTGKIVAPQLYIAVGISGAIQHLAGMKDSKVIVAINKDPDAPIFQVADYGLVADLFQAVPELTQALKS